MHENLIEAESLSQAEFDQAEALLISLLREAYPTIDLRRGTALRDLLVRPVGASSALESRRYDELARTRSLLALAASPASDDAVYINAVLANFGTALQVGVATEGILKLQVRNPGVYRVTKTQRFVTVGGVAFEAAEDVVASTADGTLTGPDEDGYLYFTVHVRTSDNLAHAVAAGGAFQMLTPFSGYVSAVSYSDFTVGRSPETAAEALARLPVALASRGLTTRAAITSAFTNPVSDGYNPAVRALSVHGAGDPAQQRDRRNVHGLPLGGRLDVYARTFDDPAIVTLTRRGTRTADGDYMITINPADAPGYYAVKSVTASHAAPGSGYNDDNIVAVGSLDFAATPTRNTASAPAYRFSDSDSVAGTIYQGVAIRVACPTSADTAPEFKIEVYAAPDIALLQAYADRPDVRNLAADLVVRAPFVCLVGLRVVASVLAGTRLDITALKRTLCDVVNANSFTGVLTMSELVAAAHRYDIQSINTAAGRSGGFELRGSVIDAAGVEHAMVGHRLDIGTIRDGAGLILPGTTVFATSPERISVEVVQV